MNVLNLSFCECRWRGGEILRWREHLGPTYCNQTCLNCLQRLWVKNLVLNCPHTLVPFRGGGDILTEVQG